ncbi:hypothetical protein BJ508DRAFT_307457 [Ascobolus immersus RN42]|uniref:F-box domain-containing protein n=1 Tax=Ascobolus immersus RN42 TaxID=1160509 RepID=A0A3N4I4R6_ASCIM|nr:hypothetical protein BJ508DRAFT_307457 [Ascobolus immersus RN42]
MGKRKKARCSNVFQGSLQSNPFHFPPILRLPNEILHNICMLIENPATFVALGKVNRRFYALTRRQLTWEDYFNNWFSIYCGGGKRTPKIIVQIVRFLRRHVRGGWCRISQNSRWDVNSLMLDTRYANRTHVLDPSCPLPPKITTLSPAWMHWYLSGALGVIPSHWYSDRFISDEELESSQVYLEDILLAGNIRETWLERSKRAPNNEPWDEKRYFSGWYKFMKGGSKECKCGKLGYTYEYLEESGL